MIIFCELLCAFEIFVIYKLNKINYSKYYHDILALILYTISNFVFAKFAMFYPLNPNLSVVCYGILGNLMLYLPAFIILIAMSHYNNTYILITIIFQSIVVFGHYALFVLQWILKTQKINKQNSMNDRLILSDV